LFDKLERLDAIDIWCLFKPVSLSELLNCDNMLDAVDAVGNWCFTE